MLSTHTIRLLAADPKEQGALFMRLTSDLFFALGYTDLRFEMSPSAHDIDVRGKHRIEPRLMIAECKTHTKKIGGNYINRFLGALMHERMRAGRKLPIVGYFLSLGGFTESAIQQQQDMGEEAIVLLDAPLIIKELEHSYDEAGFGNMLVSDSQALAAAKFCMQRTQITDLEFNKINLLIHESGYVKAVYYTRNSNQCTHFALIHADGALLAPEHAHRIVEADRLSGGDLYSLVDISTSTSKPNSEPLSSDKAEKQALELYRDWIANDCGYIRLDGLPIDEQLSTKKLRLEKLFVPLRAELKVDASREEKLVEETTVLPIGEVLYEHKHVALLAAPGGGKSTLLKRLAIAYAFENRRNEIPDGLPPRDLLPLFLRCRDLREQISQPILLLLEDIPTQLAMPLAEADGFRRVMHEALREGQVLLLIDGLDEIADGNEREAFADNIRKFIGWYPQINLVITSRKEGFRLVAGVMASVCREAVLAPLEAKDVHYICEQWHVEVDHDSPQVRRDAQELATTICQNKNVFALSQNPLLLTTLLVVRRSIGELPTHRAALYKEAVRLLIKTWNVEGHSTLNERETLAQLSYVACSMMERNVQRILRSELIGLLEEARAILDAELQHVQLSPEEFLYKVEHRSSLLMQTGHEPVNGHLEPIYEFRHLTFQEYLAARGYVQEQHVRREDEFTLVELLTPNFENPSWKEVIPLVAVLAERRAEPLIKHLIASLTNHSRAVLSGFSFAELLGQCLLDEVTISPKMLRAALQQVARYGFFPPVKDVVLALQKSRSGALLEQVVVEEFTSGEDGWEEYASAAKEISCMKLLGFETDYATYEVEKGLEQLLDKLLKAASNPDITSRFTVAMAFAALTKGVGIAEARGVEGVTQHVTTVQARQWFDQLTNMLRSGYIPDIYAACWALESDTYGGHLLAEASLEASTVVLLFTAWRDASKNSKPLADENIGFHITLERQLARALAACAPIKRDLLQNEGIDGEAYAGFLRKHTGVNNLLFMRPEAKAALLMGWYWQGPWNDEQLADMIDNLYQFARVKLSPYGQNPAEYKRVRKMLLALGKPGQKLVKKRLLKLNKLGLTKPMDAQ